MQQCPLVAAIVKTTNVKLYISIDKSHLRISRRPSQRVKKKKLLIVQKIRYIKFWSPKQQLKLLNKLDDN